MKDSLSTVSRPSYKKVSSSNDKEDIVRTNLNEFAIALQVMAGHPAILQEYKKKVASLEAPVEEPVITQNDIQASS